MHQAATLVEVQLYQIHHAVNPVCISVQSAVGLSSILDASQAVESMHSSRIRGVEADEAQVVIPVRGPAVNAIKNHALGQVHRRAHDSILPRGHDRILC